MLILNDLIQQKIGAVASATHFYCLYIIASTFVAKATAPYLGLPDLVIAQNAQQKGNKVFSLEKHFRLLSQVLKIELYQ